MVRVEIRDLEDTSHLYYMMSQVPRVGDSVLISDEESEPDIWIDGVVTDVRWILASDKFNEDNSDCVVVKLGPRPTPRAVDAATGAQAEGASNTRRATDASL